jgi:hypothetical protein
MRAMEDPNLPEKHDSDPSALSRTDVRPQLNEQCLNLTPQAMYPGEMGDDGLQESSRPSSHAENRTTKTDNGQTPRH